jgi:hypothetical protein
MAWIEETSWTEAREPLRIEVTIRREVGLAKIAGVGYDRSRAIVESHYGRPVIAYGPDAERKALRKWAKTVPLWLRSR